MKSVCICGSGRFKQEIRVFAERLRGMGVLVWEPYLHKDPEGWEKLSEEYKMFSALGLTHDHFYKIRMADVVYVYNRDGYSGNSTTLEIGCAAALGKPIYAYAGDKEICRQVLFRELITTPEELIKRL